MSMYNKDQIEAILYITQNYQLVTFFFAVFNYNYSFKNNSEILGKYFFGAQKILAPPPKKKTKTKKNNCIRNFVC